MAERAALEVPLTTADGDLSRKVLTAQWIVPARVDLEDGALRWELHGEPGEIAGYPFYEAVPSSTPIDVLDRFCALAEGSDEQIVGFARRWGLLSLPTDAEGFYLRRGVEDLAAWRTLASDVLTALEVTKLLRDGQRPAEEHWAAFQSFTARRWSTDHDSLEMTAHPTRGLDWRPLGLHLLGEPKAVIGAFVQAWLRGVTYAFVWDESTEPELRRAPNGVVGIIGLQLASVIANVDGLATCKGCTRYFVPKHGNARWCAACKDEKRDLRAADARRRARRGGAKGGAKASESERTSTDVHGI